MNMLIFCSSQIFFINFDSLKYCIKVLSILKTVFWHPLKCCLEVSVHSSFLPNPSPAHAAESGRGTHLGLIFPQFEGLIFHFLLLERQAHL